MLCVKCGQEYEGDSCPRCNGPVIIVNNSDYLARKKAYEERLKKQPEEDTAAFSFLEDKKDNNKKKKNKKNNSNNADNKIQDKAFTKNSNDALPEDESTVGDPTGFTITKNNRKKIVALQKAAIVLSLIIIIVLIAALILRKKDKVYYNDNDHLYYLNNVNAEVISDSGKYVFAADNHTIVTNALLADYPDAEDSIASDNGKYIALLNYNKSVYELHILSASSDEVIYSSANLPDLVYISDNGYVILASGEIINYEGGQDGTVELIKINFLDSSKKVTQDSKTVKIAKTYGKYTVYSNYDCLLYLTVDNELYSYDCVNDKETSVSHYANAMLSRDSDSGLFSNTTNILNSEDADPLIIYRTDDAYYLYNFDKGIRIKLSAFDTVSQFAYKYGENYIYKIANKKIYQANIDYKNSNDQTVVEFNEIAAMLSDSDSVYLYESGYVCYIDNNACLYAVKKGKAEKIADNYSESSLKQINNSSLYISAISDGKLKVINLNSKKALDIADSDKNYKALTYANSIFYYTDSSNALDLIKENGKKILHIDNVNGLFYGNLI